ncbi:MAG: rod shape-determining protein RodA [Planctomycetes bacterium]|nr:rod shape-determining protein RodA [Planctomycetota bacterium]NUQ35741.1 rod shape-determining protein RodA [Planctomycetaceae bacterium]
MQLAFDQYRQKASQLPFGLLGTAGALVAIGLAFIASASAGEGGFVSRQTIFLAAGAFLMLLIAFTDYRKLVPFYWVAYLGGIALLVACMLFGKTVNGAKSWFMIGGFGIQVSEFCKLAYIITLAGFLRYRRNTESLIHMGAILGLTAVMLGFILLQPDFGTAMTFIPVFFALMWCSGARAKFLIPMILAGAMLMPAAYLTGLFRPHQMARINTYLASLTGGPLDQAGDGYHITMSMNAIGSGGFFGKGYSDGSIGQLDYLPERHTDFIFSVIAEELGFMGSLLITALYLTFLVFCLMVAGRTKEPFGRALAVGVATMFFAQFVINVGMTCGAMPVTGIPLPFISYGGSSLITSLLALGMVVSVHLHPSHVLGRELE